MYLVFNAIEFDLESINRSKPDGKWCGITGIVSLAYRNGR